jgi:signal transduction histidine kinase/ActR/RegA family two-component response regulator
MPQGTWEHDSSWREQLSNTLNTAVLLALSVGCLAIYLAGNSRRVLSVFDIAIVPGIVVLALERLWIRAHWRARALLTIGVIVTCTVAGISAVGLLAGGGGALLLALIFSALLLGMRAMLAVLSVVACGVAAVAALIVSGALPPPVPDDVSFTHARVWLRAGGTLVMLTALASVAVARVIAQLEAALARVRAESAQREQAQQERTRALEVAFRAQKSELLGRMAASLAHDVNNSLLVISACSEMLGDGGLSEHERKETRDAIGSAVRQASSLTGQLLSLSRKRVASPARLSTECLSEELRKVLTRLLPADTALTLECKTDAIVCADALQLQQAILNLAINARDAMPTGGCLTIRVRETAIGAPLPCVGGEVPAGRFVTFEVEDNGTGMDAETAAHAFEPLFTTKPEGKGTGLGLPSVLATVQTSGGYVKLWSERDHGTRVTLYLPIDATGTPGAAARRGVRPDLQGTAVLVADDSPEALHVMRRTLMDAGCIVLQARNGTHALELIETSPARIDVLCTDGMLPGVPVREVIVRLRELHPEAEVLVVSDYVTDERMRRGIEQGAYRVLAKPFKAEQLLHAIGDLSRRPRSGSGTGFDRAEGARADRPEPLHS